MNKFYCTVMGLALLGCTMVAEFDGYEFVSHDSESEVGSANDENTVVGTAFDTTTETNTGTDTDTNSDVHPDVDTATDTLTTVDTNTQIVSDDSADTGVSIGTDDVGNGTETGIDTATDLVALCVGCQIGAECIKNGTLNPSDACQICNADSAADGWTQRDPSDCCTANDHRVCDSDGNARWVDSCGNEGDVIETCLSSASNGACSSGWCGCREGYAGDACDKCVIYVDGTHSDDSGTGGTWRDAKATVQAGIDAAAARGCTEVWVKKGVYTPNASFNPKVSIALAENVSVRGGFAGSELSADERVEGNETVFSGNIGDKASADDNSDHVVVGAPGAILERVTVQDGYAHADSGVGGGIYYYDNSLTSTFRIVNVHIQNNRAGLYGGGVYCDHGQIEIVSSIFSGNEAKSGGAAYFDILAGEAPFVADSRFENNCASENGGAILFYSNGKVHQCEFVNNSAGFRAGAIYADGSTLKELLATSSIFSGNTAENGGAIYNYSHSGDVIMIGNVFQGNSSIESGGAVFYQHGGETIGCRFEDNYAGVQGGAMYYGYKVYGVVYSSLFENNQASEGGAIYNEYYANKQIVNCTFVNNRVTSLGGAIYDGDDTTSSLINTILWGNTAADAISGHHVFASDGKPFVAYSIIENGCQSSLLNCGDGNISDSPEFVDAAAGDYHLSSTSPAIETGDNDSVPTDLFDWNEDGRTSDLLPYDLDKNDRIVNGDGIGTAAVDIGAFEYQP